jgi:indolepyruvate ferredoxin oxidoreductase beta subunit
MVILGAASRFIDISEGSLIEAIKNLFARKGEEIVELNQKAFNAGREYSRILTA